jgi:O-antigen/teichoic acid export membrane protein
MAYQVVGGMLEQVAQPVLVETSPPALIPEQSSPTHSLSQGEGAENVERLRRVFRKILRFTAFVSFPALLGLSMVSEEFILATIGAKWQGCVPLLRILCIGGAFMPFYSLYKNLVISQGRGALNMWLNVVQIVLQLLLILMTYREGIITVVWTYTVFNILWLCVWQLYAKRLIGIRLADMLKDTLPFGCISLIIMVLTWWVTQPLTNVYGLLVARVVMAGLLYVGLMKLLRVRILDECINFILKRNKP